MMKIIKNLSILIIGLLTIISCNRPDNDTEIDLAIPVSVMDIKAGAIEEYVNTTGTVLALSKAEMKAEITGHYKLMTNPTTGQPYKLGDKVKKGQTLIRLEDMEYENNIAIESKRLNLEISQQEHEKQKSLYDKGGVTLREMRNAEVSFINAKYDYKNAQLMLDKMSIEAPIAGVIVNLPYFTPGTRINTGELLLELLDYKKMYMETNLPEKYLSIVKPGQTVRITNYTLPEDTLSGKINELSPAINTETRTFKGKILINNPTLLLKPGMFVNADIIIRSKDSTIVIRKDLILSSPTGKKVFVVEQGTAFQREITIGLENQEKAEILKGLSLNDRLVTKGFETLRNRSKVKVIK